MRSIHIYKFEELSKKAQLVAINAHSDINTEDDWWSMIKESYCDILEEEGFLDAEIYFSGFGSQGDGACFDAEIEPMKFAETIGEKRVCKLIEKGIISNFKIRKNSFSYRYSHELTRFVERPNIGIGKSNLQNTLDNLYLKISSKREQLCYDIYRSLGDTYRYLQSDAMIAATLIENGIEFTESGNVFK